MRILLLPGWLNSGPDHWQSRWEALHGDVRVLQHDWERPLRGDWMINLEEAVLQAPAQLLVAHSLGCHLVAAWAAHSQHTCRVQGALLVAPPDLTQAAQATRFPSWCPTPRQPLPFASVLVASRNDPYDPVQQAADLAACWGSRFVDAGARGHLNAESGLGDWPQAREWLHTLMPSSLTLH